LTTCIAVLNDLIMFLLPIWHRIYSIYPRVK